LFDFANGTFRKARLLGSGERRTLLILKTMGRRNLLTTFNGSFRDECLNVNWFLSLDDAKEKITAFKEEYNHFQQHNALENLTPVEALKRCQRSSETLL
jgi:putative transposase